MTKYITLVFLLFLLSCSLIKQSDENRDIQTKIVNILNSKSPEFSHCAKKSDLFKVFDQNRIRVVLFISIDEKGLLRKFKLDDKIYPESFANCIFQVADLSIFPKLKESQLIEIEQPFIFSEK